MGPLTPLDVETLQFRSGLRGYDKQEVEQFRAQVMQTLIEYIDQIGRLRMRIGEMEGEVARYRETEDLVKSSVILAQSSSEEIITAAKERAQILVEQARAEGEKVRQDLAALQNQREQFEYEFHALLSAYLARLEAHNPRLSVRSGPAGTAAASAQTEAAGLEQALAQAEPPGSAANENTAAAAPRPWNIIPKAEPAAPAAAAESGQPAQPLPAFMTYADEAVAEPQGAAGLPEAAARPAGPIPDREASTFHAFSEPSWSSAPAPEAAADSPRDSDIDEFKRALEQ